MINTVITRAEILINQQKYAEAEKILKDILPSDPHNLHILILLSEVSLQLDKTQEADQLVDIALSKMPDEAPLFYIKSRIALKRDHYNDSEKYIEEAVKLNPTDADYHAFWAHLKLTRKQFSKALELANKALSFDGENILALNVRSSALLKLDRKEDSFKTIEGALREDPNNAYTHSNYGWGLLEKGDHKQALIHFREALRIDPNFGYAQNGMIEALKASNPVYRLFLKYSFWMSNLTSKYQWAVIIGFYLGFRLLKIMSQKSEVLRPYLTPILILMALVAFSTWVIRPLSNLFLRFNTYGKYLLSKKEKLSSNFVAVSLLIFCSGLIGLFVSGDESFISIVVYGFTMMVPYSVMFSQSKQKGVLLIYAIGMAVVGIGSIATTFSTGELFNMMTIIYIIGFIAFQWFANYLLIKQANV